MGIYNGMWSQCRGRDTHNAGGMRYHTPGLIFEQLDNSLLCQCQCPQWLAVLERQRWRSTSSRGSFSRKYEVNRWVVLYWQRRYISQEKLSLSLSQRYRSYLLLSYLVVSCLAVEQSTFQDQSVQGVPWCGTLCHLCHLRYWCGPACCTSAAVVRANLPYLVLHSRQECNTREVISLYSRSHHRWLREHCCTAVQKYE